MSFRGDDPNPKQYSLGLNKTQPKLEMTHRERLKQYKNQKMKEQNLRDQHAWKLRTEMDQVKMAIQMNSDQHKRALSRAFEKAEDARKRAFDRSPG